MANRPNGLMASDNEGREGRKDGHLANGYDKRELDFWCESERLNMKGAQCSVFRKRIFECMWTWAVMGRNKGKLSMCECVSSGVMINFRRGT